MYDRIGTHVNVKYTSCGFKFYILAYELVKSQDAQIITNFARQVVLALR